MSLDTPSASDFKLPNAPPPPPMFGEAAKKKKGQGNSQPTFLGTGTVPMANQLGQKTLLGQ